MKVPFVDIGLQYNKLRKQILNKFDQLSKKGEYVLGEELQKFEEEFAKYCGTKYAVGVGNGSDALTFSLLSLNIGLNDEVIIPANSFIATAWTVANVGAKPVFVDVLDDYNIDPKEIKKKISKKTKAIIPVHLTGNMARMSEILKIAKEYNLKIIEDAAQAVGASIKGKKAGSFGTLGCFSLHPLKNLHVHGDGGIITTNNLNLYNFLKKIRNHGLKNRDELEFWGYNSRLDNIQAAIARIKLKHLDKWNKRFNFIASKYSKKLSKKIHTPIVDKKNFSIFHRYIIMVDNRDILQRYLKNNGIETKVNYPIPLHLQKASKNLRYKKGSLPIVEKQALKILSLPIYPDLSNEKIDYVIKKINNFYS